MADDVAEDGSRDGKIKVTDKRMFTADGELREGFEHLSEVAAGSESSAPERPPEPPAPEPESRAEAEPPAADTGGGPEAAMPGESAAVGAPGFMDLVGALAEPIAIYLGDAQLPDGKSAENIDAARFYIDLLEVLRTKTAGNLSSREASVLEDLLYQLRMRYVRKRG